MSLASTFKLAVVFAGVDNFSNTFGKLKQQTSNLKKDVQSLSSGLGFGGIGAGLAATSVFNDLRDYEDAVSQLQNTMMDSKGNVSSYFDDVAAKADELGAKLPGTTKDFYNMASAMRALGVSDASLTTSLDATAKMATVMKTQGVSFQQAAEATAAFKYSLGIADGDMTSFADTVQRTSHLGVQLGEMQYGFSRMTGSLKLMGWQGLSSANSLAPLLAVSTKILKSGELAGTSLNKIFFAGFEKGKFKDIDGMYKWLAKSSIKDLEDILGKGGQDLMLAISLKKGGKSDYDKLKADMLSQASLDQRVGNSLGAMSNVFEAMMGSLNKLSVAFGKLFGSDLKVAFDGLGNLFEGLGDWIDNNRELAKTLGYVSVGVLAYNKLSFVSSIVDVLGVRIKSLTIVQAAFNGVAALNPYRALALGAISLGAAMYALCNNTRDARTEAELFEDIQKRATEQTADEIAGLDTYQILLQQTVKGTEDRKKLLDEIRGKYPDYLSKLNLEQANVSEIGNAFGYMKNKITEAAKERAKFEMLTELEKNISKKEREYAQDTAEWNNAGFWGKRWIESREGMKMIAGEASWQDADRIKSMKAERDALIKNSTTNNQTNQVHVTQQIHVSAEMTEKSKTDLVRAIRGSADDIADIVNNRNRIKERLAYGGR